MLVHPSLPIKTRKMLAWDVFIVSMHAGLVHALTQSGGHKMATLTVTCFTTFKHWFLTNKMRKQAKNKQTNAASIFGPLVSIRPVVLLSLSSLLTHKHICNTEHTNISIVQNTQTYPWYITHKQIHSTEHTNLSIVWNTQTNKSIVQNTQTRIFKFCTQKSNSL